jgi:hypothetical protein
MPPHPPTHPPAQEYLPVEFQLAPTLQAARTADPEELPGSSSSSSSSGSGSGGSSGGSTDSEAADGAALLDNETQWLLYSNAGFLQVCLGGLAGGARGETASQERRLAGCHCCCARLRHPCGSASS